MAVTVTLKNYETESFDDDGDVHWERNDDNLEVRRTSKTVKTYAKGFWSAVDGKQKDDPFV